ncbi:hypothetical protein BLNAU_31 [Blattamonas nauphoetae]|uniref:Uncharacterized protein n=1 Tax=Blattamonas nauphoetae TaxID=2049346 RepID=A0ABQ9YM33_9EUKA|nr:hypothetical protein BLNAU_31 [Blattamonas nauphoetae]
MMDPYLYSSMSSDESKIESDNEQGFSPSESLTALGLDISELTHKQQHKLYSFLVETASLLTKATEESSIENYVKAFVSSLSTSDEIAREALSFLTPLLAEGKEEVQSTSESPKNGETSHKSSSKPSEQVTKEDLSALEARLISMIRQMKQ